MKISWFFLIPKDFQFECKKFSNFQRKKIHSEISQKESVDTRNQKMKKILKFFLHKIDSQRDFSHFFQSFC